MKMTNEITLTQLINNMEEYSKNNNTVRNGELHLSELSICGLKYYDKIKFNKMIPFNINFYLGNAFEYLIVRELKKLFGDDVKTQYELKYKYEDLEFKGHCDIYLESSNIIYELKTSMSRGNYKDIYLRQLKAYLIANNSSKGYLWIYKPFEKKYEEVIVNEITQADINIFNSNLKAFKTGKYVMDIENSLCHFCDVKYCDYLRGI